MLRALEDGEFREDLLDKLLRASHKKGSMHFDPALLAKCTELAKPAAAQAGGSTGSGGGGSGTAGGSTGSGGGG
mgnify:CR=1 FL=1|jgi:uncharacterized membrane protein